MYDWIRPIRGMLSAGFGGTAKPRNNCTPFEHALRARFHAHSDTHDALFVLVFSKPKDMHGRDWIFHALPHDAPIIQRLREYQSNHIVPPIILRTDRAFSAQWPYADGTIGSPAQIDRPVHILHPQDKPGVRHQDMMRTGHHGLQLITGGMA